MLSLFDPRSLYLMGGAVSLVCALMLLMSQRVHAPSAAVMRWSAGAQACFGVAMLLMSLRGIVPDLLSLPVANALGPLGTVLTYQGVRCFAQRRALPGLASVMAVALFTLLLWQGTATDAHAARLIETSLVQGVFIGACVPLLWRRLPLERRAPLAWAIGLSAACALSHAARVVQTALIGVHVAPDGMLTTSHAYAATLLISVLGPMLYAVLLQSLMHARIADALRRLATIDALTGVRMRRAFSKSAARIIRTALLRQGDAALLLIDIDRFKSINDSLGHAAGDRVLAAFARTLERTMPADAIIGRLGGEEFGVLLPSLDVVQAYTLARSLCETVRQEDVPGIRASTSANAAALRFTVSVGIAGPHDGMSLEDWLLAADRRLYAAKDAGRDRVVDHDREPAPPPLAVREALLSV